MKILVINPNTTQSMTDTIGHAAARAAAPGTTTVTVQPDKGPVSIESQYDSAFCVPGMLEIIKAAEEEGGYAGYVVACFRDPGLEAAREIATGPVIGICEAAMHAASMLGKGFSVVSTLKRSAKVQYDLARKYGFIDQLMSVRAAGVPVLELEDAHSGAADKVKAETLKAIEEDGAECVLLGCAGMVDLAQRLTQETGIPVMDGVTVAVKMVEALAGLGLGTSKIVSYAPPREKPYTGAFAANAPGPVHKRAAE
ncbi:aspartate/glutamate racemase family protein [Oceanibaculum pacificum]|uniref:Hydantoin racemase n=1 Tax=Oceanibaculum pacificum TaxID=580166 RepID=A0A154W7E6_9PROT|nr:aspartate/glutamate racemase family protein [Oceanibaculum pacificum]KZD09432.1 Asp/Glu/hydantoin racemase [Oceanibaculum pacificum]